MARKNDKYTYRVEWSEEDNAHLARCLEFSSLVAHGDSPETALHEIQNVVKATIEWMKEEGEDIPEPFGTKKFKGNLTLRIPSETHRKIAIEAAEQEVSVNQYILSKIA
jgi:predicted HicB family RNase H-like nuclease